MMRQSCGCNGMNVCPKCRKDFVARESTEASNFFETSNKYNVVPKEHLIGDILDIGCGDMSAQQYSIHANRIQDAINENRYVGIDLPDDIRIWEPDRKFSNILMIKTIAYIPISDWNTLFLRLKSWLKPNGAIVIYEAWKRSKADTFNIHHRTFDIDQKMISSYLPRSSFHIVVGRPPFTKRKTFIGYLKDFIFGNRKYCRLYLRGSLGFLAIWREKNDF